MGVLMPMDDGCNRLAFTDYRRACDTAAIFTDERLGHHRVGLDDDNKP